MKRLLAAFLVCVPLASQAQPLGILDFRTDYGFATVYFAGEERPEEPQIIDASPWN